MPPKAISMTATALELVSDTSMADIDLQVVIMGQLQAIINQLINNGQVLKNKINKMGITKVKILSVKRFSGEKAKFKGFLI